MLVNAVCSDYHFTSALALAICDIDRSAASACYAARSLRVSAAGSRRCNCKGANATPGCWVSSTFRLCTVANIRGPWTHYSAFQLVPEQAHIVFESAQQLQGSEGEVKRTKRSLFAAHSVKLQQHPARCSSQPPTCLSVRLSAVQQVPTCEHACEVSGALPCQAMALVTKDGAKVARKQVGARGCLHMEIGFLLHNSSL